MNRRECLGTLAVVPFLDPSFEEKRNWIDIDQHRAKVGDRITLPRVPKDNWYGPGCLGATPDGKHVHRIWVVENGLITEIKEFDYGPCSNENPLPYRGE